MKKQWLTTGILSAALFGAALMAQTAKSQTTGAPAPAPIEKNLAPEAPKTAQDTFEMMLGAIEDNSYATFISRGDETFKTTLTKPQFDSVVLQLAAPFKRGAHTEYLGVLKKSDSLVYVWRLRFGENGDDSLVELSVKNEKVSGFWLM